MSLIRTLLGVPGREKFSGSVGISLGDWFNNTFSWSNMQSTAGKDVNPETAQTISAVYACVGIISETLSSLPITLKRRFPDGSSEAADDQALYWLLRDGPNRQDSTMSFFETLSAHGALRGNAYATIRRNGRGEITNLEPIEPDRVTVYYKRDAAGDNRLIYEVTPRYTGGIERYADDDMLHFRLRSQNGLTGMSPLEYARNTFGLALAQDEYAARLFSNGAMPGGILSSDQPMNEDARKANREAWQAAHGGVSNAFKVAVLSGLKWQTTAMTAEDAQYIDSRRFSLQEIARIWRVPLHKLCELERSTNNNIEQQTLDFVLDTMRPWFVRWEQTMSKQLLTQRQRNAGLEVCILERELYRGDTKTIAEAHNVYLQNGVLNRNEVRKDLELNPVEGGDEFRVPLNMGPSAADEQQTPSESPATEKQQPAEQSQSRAERALLAVLKEALERVEAKKVKTIEHQLNKLKPAQFDSWLKEYVTGELAEYYQAQVLPAVNKLALAYGLDEGSGLQTEPLVKHAAERYCSAQMPYFRAFLPAPSRQPIEWAGLSSLLREALNDSQGEWAQRETDFLTHALKFTALEERINAAA